MVELVTEYGKWLETTAGLPKLFVNAEPDYQALCEHRREGTDMQFLTLVHGLPPRA
jgi:hypothetical protein